VRPGADHLYLWKRHTTDRSHIRWESTRQVHRLLSL